MSIEQNKALVRRFINEIFVQRSFDAVDELVTDDFMWHGLATATPGRESLSDAMRRVSSGLDEVAMTIEDVIAEGDRVAVRLTSHAVQVGEFMSIPPSGRAFTIGEIHIFRVHEGRVAEHWHEADFLGMLHQLGAMPGH